MHYCFNWQFFIFKSISKLREFIFKRRSQTCWSKLNLHLHLHLPVTLCREKVHMVADGLLHGAFKGLVGGGDRK